jgi:hypothetical protein
VVDIWCTPTSCEHPGHKALGSAKVTKQIASIQRAHVLVITGGLSPSPTDVLNASTYRAYLSVTSTIHDRQVTSTPPEHTTTIGRVASQYDFNDLDEGVGDVFALNRLKALLTAVSAWRTTLTPHSHVARGWCSLLTSELVTFTSTSTQAQESIRVSHGSNPRTSRLMTAKYESGPLR